ncbi:Druantia anti-phage system protein DruA [Parvularcula oceani]|uniref:Druantia anti-phage system protein DruA n=1 Tax=Parvularcula oceani TaxID=1247963 RepID=UPI00138E144A|nr:Druantia anti-phage system protein DruA [Parvularcula oceani]
MISQRLTKVEPIRELVPFLGASERARIGAIFGVAPTGTTSFASELRDLARRHAGDPSSSRLRAFCLVAADLCEQGWALSFEHDRVVFEAPGSALLDGEDRDAAKERVRRALRRGRFEQLAEPSTRAFLRRVERRKDRGTGGLTSVADLVDDGRDLARALEEANAVPSDERKDALARVIDPIVEVCTPEARCPETGLPLLDIWRYFRHTWAHEYRSVPGRQLCFLVRNAARPNRPVMGIAMLASPVMRLSVRDSWIGWLRDDAQARIENGHWGSRSFARTLRERLDASIAEVRSDDLLTEQEIAEPTDAIVARLEQRAAGAAFERERQLRAYHEACQESGEKPKPQRGIRVDGAAGDVDWIAASEDLLFLRKRAEVLAKLLAARIAFQKAELTARPTQALKRLFSDSDGQRAIDTVLAEFRKAGLSSQVADLSVCGAVAPYNELIGGKLVALLMTSNEVRRAYATRYGGQVSVIASQMAGRPIRKPANLQVLTTTSLFGASSSQYNRLRLKAEQHGELRSDIRWRKIGRSLTQGFGTLHLSNHTFAALSEIALERHSARRVNNRFGEGTSPRLRQIREGLEALGLRANNVLNHATPRIFYACELGHGSADALVGMGKPSRRGATTAAISTAWRDRWLAQRARRAETLAALACLGPATVKASLHADVDGQLALEMEG